MRLKMFAVLTIAVVVGGCASLGGPRHAAASGALAAHETLKLAWTTESALRCGQPTAIDGHCVSPEKDKALAPKFELAFKYDAQALRLTAAVPEGQPTPAEALDLGFKVYALIKEILADLPKDAKPTATLAKSLEGK